MSRYMQTSGGEFWDGDYHSNEYSIHIDDTTISDLTGEELAELVVLAYNHLDLNGHRFELIPTGDQDQEEILTYKGNT